MECPDDTWLHSAIQSFEGDENPIKILLENDDSGINVRNSEGETPLLLAAQNKNCTLELIQLLLDYGADVKATSTRNGNTALHWVAIMPNYVENIQLWRMITTVLLINGSDVNAKNLEGSIPLHLAAEAKFKTSGRIFMVHLITNSDVNARNSNGDTPVHLYMRNDKVHSSDKIIFLDIARNIKLLVNVVNSKGETLLHSAIRSAECDLELIKKLLVLGADVNMKDEMGETPYQVFCRGIFYRGIFCRGIAANEDNNNNRRREDIMMSQTILQENLQQQISSSLHVACLFHNVESVRNLLKMGADVNAVDPYGRTPLYYAVRVISVLNEDYNKQCSTLELMLDYGADINQQFIPLPSLNNSVKNIHNDNIPTFLGAALSGRFAREIPHIYVTRRLINNTIKNSLMDFRNMFSRHATKLLALQKKQAERGINVQLLNEENRRILMEDRVSKVDIFYFGTKLGYKERLSRCSRELQAMSKTKILDESEVTFFDLLVSNPNNADIYSKNKKLIEVFQAKKNMFPMYQGMLEAKVDPAVERRKLIDSAVVLLSDTLQFADLNDDFYEETLYFCSTKHLLSLIS